MKLLTLIPINSSLVELDSIALTHMCVIQTQMTHLFIVRFGAHIDQVGRDAANAALAIGAAGSLLRLGVELI